MLQELQHIVEHTAQKDYGRPLGTAHTAEKLIQLVHFLGPCCGKEFLGIGNDKDAVLEGRNVLLKIPGELAPIGRIHHLGSHFGNACGGYLGRHKTGYEVFPRAGISQDEAVQTNAGAVAKVGLCNLELLVKFFQLRDQGVLCDEALLRALNRNRFSAKPAVFCFRTVILSAFFASHMLLY